MPITQSTSLPLQYGIFNIAYHKSEAGSCVSISFGDVTIGSPIVRFHSSCLFGESLHALDCDCAKQLTSTLQLIVENCSGVVIYEYAEGRGIGLEDKIRALEIQHRQKVDTIEAFRLMGFNADVRSYQLSIEALKDLNVSPTVKLASQNPHKRTAIEEAEYKVTGIVHLEIEVTEYNKPELLTKKYKLGYSIENV
jgi:GTP cyclohydrolase II